MRCSTLALLTLLALRPVGAALPELSYNPKHAEMVQFLLAAAAASPYVSVATVGQSVRGRDIAVVTLKDPTTSPLNMVRLLALCRQHGNEPAGTVGMLQLIRDLADGRLPALQTELGRVCVQIVPMVNPDGADANTRHNANDVDLNREWNVRTQPEAKAVEYLYNLWRPEVVLDLHELHWRDEYGLNTVEAPDQGAGYPGIEQEARDLQSRILQRLQAAGFPIRSSDWDRGSNLTLCHRHYLLDHGRVSLLFESERQGFRTPLPRRALMHRIGVQTAIDYYYQRGSSGRGLPSLGPDPTAEPSRAPYPTYNPPPLQLRESRSGAGRGSLGPSIATSQPASIAILEPEFDAALSGDVTLTARVDGVTDLRYLALRVDGQGRFFTDRPTLAYQLRTGELTAGRHVLRIEAYRQNGELVQHEQVFTVTHEQPAQ